MYNAASIRWIWNDWLRQILILDHYDFDGAYPKFVKGEEAGPETYVLDLEMRIGYGDGIWLDAVHSGAIGGYSEPGLYEDYLDNMVYVLNQFTTWLKVWKR